MGTLKSGFLGESSVYMMYVLIVSLDNYISRKLVVSDRKLAGIQLVWNKRGKVVLFIKSN